MILSHFIKTCLGDCVHFCRGILARRESQSMLNRPHKWGRDQIRSFLSSMKSHRFEKVIYKNMETIYWTCGGVANMVNIIIVGLNSFFLGSHNSQEVTLPRKSQLPCAITFSSSHYPPLRLDWPHAPKRLTLPITLAPCPQNPSNLATGLSGNFTEILRKLIL